MPHVCTSTCAGETMECILSIETMVHGYDQHENNLECASWWNIAVWKRSFTLWQYHIPLVLSILNTVLHGFKKIGQENFDKLKQIRQDFLPPKFSLIQYTYKEICLGLMCCCIHHMDICDPICKNPEQFRKQYFTV